MRNMNTSLESSTLILLLKTSLSGQEATINIGDDYICLLSSPYVRVRSIT